MLSALYFVWLVITEDLFSPSPYREITEAEHYELLRHLEAMEGSRSGLNLPPVAATLNWWGCE